MERRFTGRREVGEDVAPLLPQRGDDGEDALDEAAAILAVGTETDLPPDDRAAQSALGDVVHWLDAGGQHEGEESGLVLQDPLGHPLGLGVAAHRGLAEQAATDLSTFFILRWNVAR